ncbi:hypothetical protein [Leptospira stimsonii]|uniref:hypothetical protein n=1 Tax=Leptospira stimsonii TaxID=2202203 RepID=UPI0019D69633|nr:hypothetical protein [Leptospira stimsonii]
MTREPNPENGSVPVQILTRMLSGFNKKPVGTPTPAVKVVRPAQISGGGVDERLIGANH